MTARFLWKQRKTLRRIEQGARETADPVERLRYVRNQMDSPEPPKEFRWWQVRRTAAMIAAAIGSGLRMWRVWRIR